MIYIFVPEEKSVEGYSIISASVKGEKQQVIKILMSLE